MAGQSEFILNSVIELTQQRQLIPLATSLVNTVAETLDADWVTLIDVRTDNILAVKGQVPQWHWRELVSTCAEEQQLLVDDILGVAIAIPIFSDIAVSHVLYVVSSKLGLHQQYFLSGFARIYENFLALVHENESDTLTSLLNKKAFFPYAERIIQSAPPVIEADLQQVSSWLAIFDIDHFKSINDTLGHLYGDEVLIQLSNIMATTFGEDDALFRFGGDEFVVMLAPRTKQEAEALFRRFKSSVHTLRSSKLPSFSISVGIAHISNADNPNQLIANADRALYYVKESGRDDYCFFSDLLKAGKLSTNFYQDDIELF
ncbi:GGDEF domain-containing protein [Shewanella sp. NIFS-20-20]|uniref:GGDEF domain-containing protein n=1 Tax=Shewanella sp. NIFS-20-20 TaxID=2853806 RepID=UPI001C44FF4D|nr:GGDEF domain-containing protein [Shewanella sp. NIFS-20-20]MBV7317079.1 GGDEF domain-containing protein [Shewanella sp. NIFS-20-20]